MESLKIELVFNASAQLISDNTLSSPVDFLPEQLNQEGHWEVAISEVSHPSIYQNVTERKCIVLTGNIHSRKNLPSGIGFSPFFSGYCCSHEI